MTLVSLKSVCLDIPQEITYSTPNESCVVEEQKSFAASITPVSLWERVFQDSPSQNTNVTRTDLQQRVLQVYGKHFGNVEYDPWKLEELAEKLLDENKFVDAEEVDRLAIALADHFLTPDHNQTIIFKGNLAYNFDSQGKYNEAEKLEVEVVNSLARTYGKTMKTHLLTKQT